MRIATSQQPGQFFGVFRQIVDAGQQHIFVGNSTPRDSEKLVRRGQDFLQANAFIHRHNFRTQLVVGSVQ